jgi:L-methionine (R)-S-oxide reductase
VPGPAEAVAIAFGDRGGFDAIAAAERQFDESRMVDGAADEARHWGGDRGPGGYHIGELFVLVAEVGVFDTALERGTFQPLGEVAPVAFGDGARKRGGAGREKVGPEAEQLGTRLADDREARRGARFNEYESRLRGLPGAGNDSIPAGGRDFAQCIAGDDQIVGGERGCAGQIGRLPIRMRQQPRAAFAERWIWFKQRGMKPREYLERRDGGGTRSGPEVKDGCGRRRQAACRFGEHMMGGGIGCRQPGKQVGGQFLLRLERDGGARTVGAVVVRQHGDGAFEASVRQPLRGEVILEKLEYEIGRMHFLYDASMAFLDEIEAALGGEAGLQRALEMTIGELKAESGTVHLLEQDGVLHLKAASGIPDVVLRVVQLIPVGKGMAGLAVERAEPVSVCNLQTDTSGDVKPGARKTGMEGAIVVPVMAAGRPVGALGVANREERTFTEEEIGLLMEVGRRIAG